MSARDTTFYLQESFFGEKEKQFIEYGSLSASTFRFDSGVLGLRLKSDRGELVMLPFQGQQIWSAEFDGRPLTMTSMFPEPRPTQVFLETFGAFLLHCGATAMGGPSAQDSHPLHGELPNAPTSAPGPSWAKMNAANTSACPGSTITSLVLAPITSLSRWSSSTRA
jgi:hypothetical protein